MPWPRRRRPPSACCGPIAKAWRSPLRTQVRPGRRLVRGCPDAPPETLDPPRLAALCPGGGDADPFRLHADGRDLLAELLFTRHRAAALALHRPRQLRGDDRRSGLLAGGEELPLVCGRYHSDLDRNRSGHGALGEFEAAGAHPRAHGLLHADDPADDRRRQHLAVILYPGHRLARPVGPRSGPRWPQLAGKSFDRAARDHRHDDLEGSRLLHDLLSGGTADDSTGAEGCRDHRGREPLDLVPARGLSPADADDSLRAGQFDDQIDESDLYALHLDHGLAALYF